MGCDVGTPLHKPCLVICNTRAACRFCSLDHGLRALSKLQFQCLNVDWNDTLLFRDLWIIAWIYEKNLWSVYCKSSSSSSKQNRNRENRGEKLTFLFSLKQIFLKTYIKLPTTFWVLEFPCPFWCHLTIETNCRPLWLLQQQQQLLFWFILL
jgi:hypothetical protein